VIEAVGFDFDHTLGFDHRLERTVALELGRDFASSRHAPFDDAGGAAFDVAIARYRGGGAPFVPAMTQYFRGALAAAHPSEEDVAALIGALKVESLRRAPEFVRAGPGVAETLAAVAAMGLPTAILTNGWNPLQQEKARLIGFGGTVLASDAIGARKPEPEAFALLARALGAPAGRIAYVGDDPAVDVAGAARAGMAAVWLDAEDRPYPPELSPPAVRIGALAELVPWLQGPLAQAANPPA
jgi:HAD superfamily hydrolase (TIGR01509 family)